MAKRLICVIISVLMIVSLLPTGAFAADSGADEVPVGVAADTDSDEDDVEEADENPEEGEPAAADPTDEPAEEVVAAVETEETVEAEATNDESATTVATIGDNSYSTLAEAIAAVTGSDQTTITLTADTTASSAITISNTQNIILDLGRYTLTITGSETYTGVTSKSAGLINNGILTIKNGTVTKTSNALIVNTGNLTIDSDATVTGYSNAVCNYGGTVSTSGALSVTYNSSTSSAIETFGGTVYITGGSVTGASYAITIYNSAYDSTNTTATAANVYISGGTISAPAGVATNNTRSGYSNLTITGGTISGTYDAIYWPSAGTITIGTSGQTDHSSPSLSCSYGSTIGICCGKLIVYGGTITSTISSSTWTSLNLSAPLSSESYANTVRNSSGMLGLGDAISIYSNRSSSYAQYGLEVNIVDGVFTAASGYAVRYTDSNLASDTDTTDTTQTVSVALNGGTYTGGIGASNVSIAAVDTYVEDEDKAIVYGGTYLTTISDGSTSADTSVIAYLADGVSLDSATGTVTSKAVAQIGDTTYTSLADAISAAVSGDTVELISDATIDSYIEIKSTQNITLDLNSYTVSGSISSRLIAVSGTLTITADEGGTITNTGSSDSASVISNGNKLIIESGNITASQAYAIYNQGTLTVNGGTLTGGNNYALYIAAGNVTINGGTFTSTSTSVGAVRNIATLTIKDGTVGSSTGDAYGVYNTGTVTVDGGTLSGSTAGIINIDSGEVIVNAGTLQGGRRGLYNSTGTATIYGGTFTGTEYGLMTNNPETNTTTVYAGSFSGGSRAIIGYLTSTIAEGSKVTSGAYDQTSCVVEVCVAKVGSNYYVTLQAAITAASSGATVTLVSDTTEDVVISGSKTINLDLNGCKITNSVSHTITVEIGSTLTITDGSTKGTGEVDNVTHAKAAIYNNGTVTLNGGTYNRSEENGQSSSDNGGNSFYVILNHGTMKITEGVKVVQDGAYSSMIENGYQSYNSGNASSGYVEGTNAQYPSLTITGGYFDGGLNTVKNDDGGTLTISGGEFKNVEQYAVMNWNNCTITGGTFASTSAAAIFSYEGSAGDVTTGTLTITGGTFTSAPGYYVVYSGNSDNTNISGGTYKTSDGSTVYLTNSTDNYAGGFYPTANTDGSYGVSKLTLGASSDTGGTTSVEATSISGYGEATMYVGVANPSTYYSADTESSTGVYPTTSLTFTEDGEAHKYVFAGWYSCDTETGEYTAMNSFPTGEAYAKFVDINILMVQAQVLTGTNASSESTSIRFVSTVDSLDYKQVGFKITLNGKTNIKSSSTVYKTVYASSDDETVIASDPSYFCDSSMYFMTYAITGIKNTYFDYEITVQAFWTTLDGTTVYGDAVVKKVSDSY